ncbi:hypothetical protein D3C85_1934740 [compost metagenome]
MYFHTIKTCFYGIDSGLSEIIDYTANLFRFKGSRLRSGKDCGNSVIARRKTTPSLNRN